MRILKIESLPSVKDAPWLDRDYQMLHACFQLLKDYVEGEDPFNHSRHWAKSKAGRTCKELYDWWLIRQNDEAFDADKDDDKKLIQLMKIRQTLWT